MLSPYDIFLGKYGSFTEIQRLAFDAISKGSGNCLIIAPTGSGKTEAALLPVMDGMLRGKELEGRIQTLYITPLRALNRDLIKRLEWLCKETGISVGVRHGDTGRKERKEQAENPPRLLITTPETVHVLLLSEKFRNAFRGLKFVVVDEVHELYPNKRGAQLAIGLERLRRIAGDFRRIGISATVGDERLASRFLFGGEAHRVVKSGGAKRIEAMVTLPLKPVSRNRELAETFGLDSAALARLERIAGLVQESKACIVFANTRQVAEALGSRLLYLDRQGGFGGIAVHHGSLDRDERIRVENEFKEGRIKAIIATSSLELGIDIGKVDLVIQYGSPKQTSRFLQRIGRSGHGENRVSVGQVIVSDEVEALESSAIIDDALVGKIESEGMEEGALDVAMNQLCAMVMERRSVSVDEVFSIITSAAPYSNLSRDAVDRLVALGSELRLFNARDGILSLGSRGMSYFFSNISVIPDSQRFLVKEAVSNRTISSLDERFVYNYLDEGSSFITKGMPWRVVNVEEGVIYVEHGGDIGAAVPDWEGEDIPVSKTIASAVFEFLGGGPRNLTTSMDSETAGRATGFREKQLAHFTVGDGNVVIEELDDYTIIYTGIGKHANEFLALMLKAVLAQSFRDIEVRASTYAVAVWFGNATRRPDMASVMAGLHTVQRGAGDIITSSDIFRYKFVQVAKLFGVIDKKATLTRAAAIRLVEFYKNTPVFEETVRDLYKNNFDAGTVARLLSSIHSGGMGLKRFRSAGSPLSDAVLGVVFRHAELLQPGGASGTELDELEEKLDGSPVTLLCTFCGFVGSENVSVKKEQEFLCHSCRSPMLCIYSEALEGAVRKKLDGKRLSGKMAGDYEEAVREAGLISAHGNRAVIALSTYGIGSVTAARILRYSRKSMRLFLSDVILAQKTFIRTKKFWG